MHNPESNLNLHLTRFGHCPAVFNPIVHINLMAYYVYRGLSNYCNKFGHAIIVPLIKDRSGNLSKLSNYKGISLSPTISTLFEICLVAHFPIIYRVIIYNLDSRKALVVLHYLCCSTNCWLLGAVASICLRSMRVKPLIELITIFCSANLLLVILHSVLLI